jgi:hypothetical protein
LLIYLYFFLVSKNSCIYCKRIFYKNVLNIFSIWFLFPAVKPGNPIIRVNGHDISQHFGKNISLTNSNHNEKHTLKTNELLQQIGPFAESSTIVFECSTSGGRPLPEVKWLNGTKPMRSKITIIDSEEGEGPMVVSTMRIIATRYDLGAKFECRVFNNATVTPLFQWIRLDIQVKPLSLKVRGPTQAVVAGEMVSLTCSVEGARPAANITWYNRSEVVNPHPSASTDLMSDGTYRYDSFSSFPFYLLIIMTVSINDSLSLC